MKVKDYAKVLVSEEGPGILNRLLEGIAAWKEEGLLMPPEVAAATAEFRAAQNVIRRYFDTHTITRRDCQVRMGALYGEYTRWATDQGGVRGTYE